MTAENPADGARGHTFRERQSNRNRGLLKEVRGVFAQVGYQIFEGIVARVIGPYDFADVIYGFFGDHGNAFGIRRYLFGAFEVFACLVTDLQDMGQRSAEFIMNIARDLLSLFVQGVNSLQAMDFTHLAGSPKPE